MGYTSAEIDDAQARWQLRFPPDLVALLRERRPLITGRLDWLTADRAAIRQALDAPFEGFWFDVRESAVWWPEWGEKPAAPEEQRERLHAVFAAAPKLIPLSGHRYLPETPFEPGNPVFSVHQTDVICYGADLADWLAREQDGYTSRPWPAIKPVRFWSDAVRHNNES